MTNLDYYLSSVTVGEVHVIYVGSKVQAKYIINLPLISKLNTSCAASTISIKAAAVWYIYVGD